MLMNSINILGIFTLVLLIGILKIQHNEPLMGATDQSFDHIVYMGVVYKNNNNKKKNNKNKKVVRVKCRFEVLLASQIASAS